MEYLENFEIKFNILHKKYFLSETLKIHVIKHHFRDYFEKTGKNFCDTNGESLESVHSSLRISEERHGFKIVRKIGTPVHAVKSSKSLVFYNSKRAIMTPPLRKVNTPSK